MKSPSALNAANLITLLRICLIPIFFILLYYTYRPVTEKTENSFRVLSLMVYFPILFTNFLDGHLARGWRLETRQALQDRKTLFAVSRPDDSRDSDKRSRESKPLDPLAPDNCLDGSDLF